MTHTDAADPGLVRSGSECPWVKSYLVRGIDLTDHRYVQISPDVIFSADIFTPAYLGLPANRTSNRAERASSDKPDIDSRQIDMWADDVDHSPV
ncbi:hypothetical protein G3O06_01700 [Burkholderia sp. Ac-20345]|uniref:hypothetical protein n=1 Tax=Burkholderia sp. Ac-20345 TaxID=2703891 RepID=UPI00197BA7CA|nr:hypothetical protein [Burkholderia sp. Ac-20345]MBN3776276.1 hypothetical protein [Burkholderia sp. Ac-20345]